MDSRSKISVTKKVEEISFNYRSCTNCDLHKYRKVTIRGQGRVDTGIVAVIDRVSPGGATSGDLFYGGEGKALSSILKRAGILPSAVWVTPVVACPTGSLAPRERGRIEMLPAPKLSEAKACQPRLYGELHSIQPYIILAFGPASIKALYPKQSIVVGRVVEAFIQGDLVEYAVPMMPLPSINQLYRNTTQNVGGMWNKTLEHIREGLEVARILSDTKEKS
jgi:uracil-DNA glycosylase family 4